jgi:hypothetical protein
VPFDPSPARPGAPPVTTLTIALPVTPLFTSVAVRSQVPTVFKGAPIAKVAVPMSEGWKV